MQEQRFKEAKKAVVTPLMNHMATPSNFPQPEEACVDETLDSTELGDRRLKKPLQVEEEVVAAIELVFGNNFNGPQREQKPELKKLQLFVVNGLYKA